MIEDIVKEFEQVRKREEELNDLIAEHYHPIITDLYDKKDKEGLEKLLNTMPECGSKLRVYQTLSLLEADSST